ncbi:MAG: LysM peptidoglycan-binding domain-containing protein [Clostridiales bacterium]|nr:LysM peptidoglycan-binding domain-containing protein [Clostridiales bacterium]
MEQQPQNNASRICPRGASYYIWREGDTLSSLAQRNSISARDIESFNPEIPFQSITAGTEICLPARVITSQQEGPVLDGTAQDDNTVTPGMPLPPIVPTRPSQPCPIGYTTQRVQAGQTYADLLINLNVSYKAMRNANPTLRPGAMTAGALYCAPPAGTRETCSGRRSYTIEDGDNLTAIARRLNTTTGRLLMLNPTLLPTDFSQPGFVICIP